MDISCTQQPTTGFCLCVNAYVGGLDSHKPGDDGRAQRGWNKTSSSSFPIRLPLSIITITFKTKQKKNKEKKKAKIIPGEKRTSSIKCERIPENRKHTPIEHYMRRHENFPKIKIIFFFFFFRLPFPFSVIYDVNAKKKHLLKFPSQVCVCVCVYYTRYHTVAGLGNRSVHWIYSKFSLFLSPTRLGKKRKKKRIVRIVWQTHKASWRKKLNRCHLYSSTGPNVLVVS